VRVLFPPKLIIGGDRASAFTEESPVVTLRPVALTFLAIISPYLREV